MAGDAGCQITETQRSIWQLNRPLVVLISGGRCSFPINQLDHCNWKSIAPLDSVTLWRAMQDSNPRLRLRRPEGYPDYPNRPYLVRQTTPS